ncbi:MAG: NUDIX hydrolase [Victivallales bacterium]|nr:NUDIX hydrolase [Victivallales bacterium]
MKTHEPHNIDDELLCHGNWLSLHRLAYINKHGAEKTWECAMRNRRQGAAMMIAVMAPSQRLILIRQFRPPLAGPVVEFPAGLIDPGEDAAATAVRELYEETGYHGKVTAVAPPSCNSPGLTGELITTVMMQVDDSAYPEPPATPAMEDDEDIVTFLVARHELLPFLTAAVRRGDMVDSKLLAFAWAGKYFHDAD